MIIRRSLTPLNYSRRMAGPSAGREMVRRNDDNSRRKRQKAPWKAAPMLLGPRKDMDDVAEAVPKGRRRTRRNW